LELTWVEISEESLAHNLSQFADRTKGSLLAPVVKSNAYGHGLVPVAQAVRRAGAHWLCVNALFEGRELRRNGIDCPVYVLGYVPPSDAGDVVAGDFRIVVYDAEVVKALSDAASACGRVARVHIKVETGNHRQGLPLEETLALADLIRSLPWVELEGISSHYADIEDTTDHSFARQQLSRFLAADEALRERGSPATIRSFSNSAATILWPETHFELVRIGVSLYGMWPSKETYVSALMRESRLPDLRPVMTWKTVIAQVKVVRAGEHVGYGRTFQATHDTVLAVLPIGYYDGYDRGLSNLAHVLIRGQIAPVRGRVCMNMTMVDVTDIPGTRAGEEVVLLGHSGQRSVTAEQLASWGNTINYEVTTRINERIPRIAACS
jgi:alanine racemase